MKHVGTLTIETERLILRRFILDDAAAMLANWAADKNVTKFLTWQPHKSVEDSKTIISEWLSCYEKDSFYQWAIELKEIEQPIGSIGVVREDERTQAATVGYCIGQGWWGKGYAAEALHAVIGLLFEKVGYNSINACHDKNNPNSGKVMAKSGMTFDGILRAAGYSNVGIFDMVCYSILKSEYEKQ